MLLPFVVGANPFGSRGRVLMENNISKNRRSSADILFVFGLFILIYNPPLIMLNTMHIVGLLSIFYLVIMGGVKRLFVLQTSTIKIIGGFALIFMYLFTFACLINGQSMETILFPIYFIVDIIPFGMAMKKYMEKNRLRFDWTISIVINSALLQALFAIVTLLVPSIQRYFVDRMVAYGYNEIYTTLASYRMYGFSNALTNATPVVQSIIAVIAVWLALNRSKRYYFVTLVIMLSAIINARISIVVFAIGIVILVLTRSTNSWDRIKILFVTAIAYGVIVGIVFPIIQDVSPLTYEWITDGVNELSTFKFGTTSYESGSYFRYLINKDRFVLPEGTFSLFFGKGYSIMSSKNPSSFQSDVGYICDLWVGGIIYIVLLYTFFGGMLIKLRKNKNKLISFIASFYIVALLFINIKGVAFSMNAYANLLVIIICVSPVVYRKGEELYD